VLLIITHRPEWRSPFAGHNHVTSLQLNRLSRAQVADIVRAVAQDHIPEDMIAHINARTDGVPLFIEELTKSVLESGLDMVEADIPDTLQSSLLARIDRLGSEAREIVQIGAVIGREFPYTLLEAVAEKTESELGTALERLSNSELVFRSGVPPHATYRFKHMLIQEAAYESLLKGRRQQLHSRIADELSTQSTTTAPELLARHLAEAGRQDEAVDAWIQAGVIAQDLSVMAEAAAAFENAIEQMHLLPSSEEMLRRELEILGRLGVAVLNNHGPASKQAEQVQRRASAVAEKLDDRMSWFSVQFGLWRIHNVRAEYDQAISVAKNLLDNAHAREDPDTELQAHHALWSSYQFYGDLLNTKEHIDRALEIYDVDRHGGQAMIFGGHDACECALMQRGNIQFATGHPEAAMASNRLALEHATMLDHPQITAHSYNWSLMLPQQLGDLQTLEERIEFIQPLIEQYDLTIYTTEVQIHKAWLAVCREADRRAAVAMQEHLDRRTAMGTVFLGTYFSSLIADAWRRLGDPERAIDVARRGIAGAQKTGERFFLSELHRNLGVALASIGEPDHEAAQNAFETAINISRDRAAVMYELRATTDYARLLQAQGENGRAQELLAPLYNGFVEGFETPDLIEAKALLDELH
jgi:predicted ATPase